MNSPRQQKVIDFIRGAAKEADVKYEIRDSRDGREGANVKFATGDQFGIMSDGYTLQIVHGHFLYDHPHSKFVRKVLKLARKIK